MLNEIQSHANVPVLGECEYVCSSHCGKSHLVSLRHAIKLSKVQPTFKRIPL
jgi:hypothetical protein